MLTSSRTHVSYLTHVSRSFVPVILTPKPTAALAAPSTPLNLYLLQALASARKDICIITPNLTSPPVLSAVIAVLKRGVNATIVTNRRMMVLEQVSVFWASAAIPWFGATYTYSRWLFAPCLIDI